MVTATKNKNNKFDYNPITVVLMTEALKLVAACAIYLKKFTVQQMFIDIAANKISK